MTISAIRRISLVLGCGLALSAVPFANIAPAHADSPFPLQVSVGYADGLRANPVIPSPWSGSPGVTFIGDTADTYDGGAIMLTNPGTTAVLVSDVKVDLASTGPGTGPSFDLWSSFNVPAGGTVILSATAALNFDTSDFPTQPCGQPLADGTGPIPLITISLDGAPTTLKDSGHILTTGGTDTACTGANESLGWRAIGTSGAAVQCGHAAGTFDLTAVGGPSGAPDTITVANVRNQCGDLITGTQATIQITDPGGAVSPPPLPTCNLIQGTCAVTATETAVGRYDVTATVESLTQTTFFAVSAVISNLTLTTDEPAVPAGAANVPLASIPVDRLAAELRAPIDQPVGSVPVGSVPVGSVPVGSVPVGSVPVGSVTVLSPVGSVPVGSVDLAAVPVGSVGLDNILISTLTGVDWTFVLAASPALRDREFASITLRDVLNDANASARFNSQPLSRLFTGSNFLSGTSYGALLLGGIFLDAIPVPDNRASWCDEINAYGGTLDCAHFSPSSATLLGEDIGGQPVGSVPVGSVPVGSVTVGLTGSPVGSVPVGSVDLKTSGLAQIRITDLPTPDAVVDCSRVDCSSASSQSLADAAALSPSAVLPAATLADIGTGLGGTTLGSLIAGILVRSDFPWENLQVEGMQDFAGTGAALHYHADFDIDCYSSSSANWPSVRVTLPPKFRYVAGTATYSLNGGPSASLRDPQTDFGPPPATAPHSWTVPASACNYYPTYDGQTFGHVTVSLTALPGLDLGTYTGSVVASISGGYDAVDHQAPVQVNPNWAAGGDAATAPVISRDSLVIGHVANGGDVVRFRYPVPPTEGTRVQFFLSHIAAGSDFDLTIGTPNQTSLQASPTGSLPVGSVPIEDQPQTQNNINNAAPAETLQDVPVGSVPVGSVSTNRGNRDDSTEVTSDGEGGYYQIQVSGYNGSSASGPFVLRVKESVPVPLPPCPARTFPNQATSADAGVLTPASAVAPTTKSLFLVNRTRLTQLYGAAAVAPLISQLQQFVGRPEVLGQILYIDGASSVMAQYAAWDQQPCSIRAANNVVLSINQLVAQYRSVLSNLRFMVMVGSDDAIPLARRLDRVKISPEFHAASDLQFLTFNRSRGNAVYAAEATNHFLTDDAYVSFTHTQWSGREMYLPSISAGRLVETPAEISAQLTQFSNNSGTLSPQTALTTAYGFLTAGGNDISNSFGQLVGATGNSQLISDTWTRADYLNAFFNNSPIPDVVSPNAHYNHWEAQPAHYDPASSALVTTADLPATAAMPGRIIFTMGCHAGLNIPDTQLLTPDSTQSPRLHDWVQSYADQGVAVYVANTGFGYADDQAEALSAKLMALFAGNFNDTTYGSIGERWVQAKHQYFDSMGSYGVYDEKALMEATFYGLPMYALGAPATPVAPAQAHKTAVPTPASPLAKVTAPAAAGAAKTSSPVRAGAPASSSPTHTAKSATGARAAAPVVPHPLQPHFTTVSRQKAEPRAGLAARTITVTPNSTQNTGDNGGTYWAALDSNGNPHTMVMHYRPIQPEIDLDVSQANTNAHGVLITALSTQDIANVTPAVGHPTIDQTAHEALPRFGDSLFPANILHMARSSAFGVEKDRMVLVGGQFRPDPSGNGTGVERLVTGLTGEVLYSTSSDSTAPLIDMASATRSEVGADQVRITVSATDGDDFVAGVNALYLDANNNWNTVQLAQIPNTHLWTASILSSYDIQVMAEAFDTAGNVGYMTDKGTLVGTTVITAPPTVTIASPADGGTFAVGQPVPAKYFCGAIAGVTSCSGPVSNGAKVDTASAGTKTFSVQAVDAQGNHTTTTHTYTVLGSGTGSVAVGTFAVGAESVVAGNDSRLAATGIRDAAGFLVDGGLITFAVSGPNGPVGTFGGVVHSGGATVQAPGLYLTTAGSYGVSVATGKASGFANFTVTPAAASQVVTRPSSAIVLSGTAETITVETRDVFGNLSAGPRTAHLTITDPLGRVEVNQDVALSRGRGSFSLLPTQDLLPGTYLVDGSATSLADGLSRFRVNPQAAVLLMLRTRLG